MHYDNTEYGGDEIHYISSIMVKRYPEVCIFFTLLLTQGICIFYGIHLLFLRFCMKACMRVSYIQILLLICLQIFSTYAFAQEINYIGTIGNFNNAITFSYSASGFLYVIDARSSEVIKLDTIGNQLKSAGGFGWSVGLFDNPCDIFATPLQVYVTDKNNHRIQQFDKDLNYVSGLAGTGSSNQQQEFKYPAGCVTSKTGDFFVLDSENKRVIKYDVMGNYNSVFGDFTWGNYALQNPKKIRVYGDDQIAVLDELSILIFDYFGNGIRKIPITEHVNDFISTNRFIVLNNERDIFLLSQDVIHKADISGISENIVSIQINGNSIYILTPTKILIFQISFQ